VERPIADGFINNDIAVTDFDVVKARWVGANPGLVLDGSSLATEIRKRNQITFTTFATPRKCVFHEIASFLTSLEVTIARLKYWSVNQKVRRNENVSRGGASAAASASPQQSYLVSTIAMIPHFLTDVSNFMKFYS
jgi:hypothetical protein